MIRECMSSSLENGPEPPKVSIVMTAFNADRYIESSISAALAQDYANFEVVFLDDGSSDATENICKAIKDPRFHYIRCERMGRSRALNEAIRRASGDYIAINDADDLSVSWRLSYVVGFLLDNPDVAIAATRYISTDIFPGTIPEISSQPAAAAGERPVSITVARLYRSNPLVHSTAIYPRSIWRRVKGYDESLEMCIDYDFFIRAMRHGGVVLLPLPAVIYYRNPSSFFKTKSSISYLHNLRIIRRRARTILPLPKWARIYDLIPWYAVIKWQVMNFVRGSMEQV